MILRPVHPVPGAAIEIGAPGTRETLRELYRRASPEEGIRLNLIASIDGSARGDDGTSESLSNRADRALLGAIRAESDVVLIGAGTLRREGYLLPRAVPLAVVTRTGELGGAELRGADDAERLIVIAPDVARARVDATLGSAHRFVDVPDDGGRIAAADIVHALAAVGLPRIVCEGGPALAASFLDASLVGEVCLSTSPRLVGGSLPVLGSTARPATPARLMSLLVDDADGVYARWSLG